MSGMLFTFFLLFAGGTTSGTGFEFYDQNIKPYVDYPGFELWRFLNLGIYLAILVYFIKKPLSEGFKQKREAIRAELIKAEEVRNKAMAELAEMESKLASLETEKKEIVSGAQAEAEAERMRINLEGEAEVKRLQSQAEAEINRKSQQIANSLRRMAAEESVKRAEAKIKQKMTPEKDSVLVGAGIKSIGGAGR